jgi:hypothetical protein
VGPVAVRQQGKKRDNRADGGKLSETAEQHQDKDPEKLSTKPGSEVGIEAPQAGDGADRVSYCGLIHYCLVEHD